MNNEFLSKVKSALGIKDETPHKSIHIFKENAYRISLESIISKTEDKFLNWKKDEKQNQELQNIKDLAIQGNISAKIYIKNEMNTFITVTFPDINEKNIDGIIKQYYIDYYQNLYKNTRPNSLYKAPIYDYFEKYRLTENSTIQEKMQRLVTIVYQQLYGLGPVDEIVEDEININSLWCNRKDDVRIQFLGRKVKLENVYFKTDNEYETTIKYKALAASTLQELSISNPLVICSRLNGSRITTSCPPRSRFFTLDYRNFDNAMANMDKLVDVKTIDADICEWNKITSIGKINETIIGPQSAGKSTYVKAKTALYSKDLSIAILDAIDEHRLEDLLPEYDIRTLLYGDGDNGDILHQLLATSYKQNRDLYIFTEIRKAYELYESLNVKQRAGKGCLDTYHSMSLEEYIETASNLAMETGKFRDFKEAIRQIIQANQVWQILAYNEVTGQRYLKQYAELLVDETSEKGYKENVIFEYDEKDKCWYSVNFISDKLRRNLFQQVAFTEEHLNRMLEIYNKKKRVA